MKNLSYIIFILFIIVSCQQQSAKQENVLYIGETKNEMPIDSLISSIYLTYLEESDSIIIGSVDKIIKVRSTYYILDSNKAKALFAYDTLGNFINQYSAQGGGPREYYGILDFDIDTINNEIVILCNPSKLIFTDMQLSFKKEVSLNNNYYDRIAINENNIYLFSYYSEKIDKYNKKGELIDKESILNKFVEGNVFFPQDVFYKLSNKLLMHSPGDDNIYLDQNDEWIIFKCLDYDNKTSSMKLYSQKKAEDITFKEKLSNPLPYIRCVFEYKQKTFYLYLYGLLHYLNDGENNFFFSKLPGVTSLKHVDGSLYTWEYLSNFNFEDPFLNQSFKNIKVNTYGTKQKSELDDGIVIIEYILKK